MKVIIGLGNPGKKYLSTRHNVGHLVIDEAKKRNLFPKNIKVFKSDVFMNDSGSFVSKILKKENISSDSLYVIHDDLDLPLGSWKMQFAKGPKDNGGINSIEQVLGTKDFWRIRVGIDKRNTQEKTPGEEYVLNDFKEEEKIILKKVISEICNKLETF